MMDNNLKNLIVKHRLFCDYVETIKGYQAVLTNKMLDELDKKCNNGGKRLKLRGKTIFFSMNDLYAMGGDILTFFSYARFENCTFNKVLFKDLNILGAYFTNCTFKEVTFYGCVSLDNCVFYGCKYDNVNLFSTFTKSSFSRCIFSNCDIAREALFKDCSFNSTGFNNVLVLTSAFEGTAFKDCNLYWNLLDTHFKDCNLHGVSSTGKILGVHLYGIKVDRCKFVTSINSGNVSHSNTKVKNSIMGKLYPANEFKVISGSLNSNDAGEVILRVK